MPPSPPPSATRSAAAAAIYFGPYLVTPQVFYTTPHTFALVNLKPILPGHTLICPLLTPTGQQDGKKKPRRRLRDLSNAEAADLFLTIRRVGNMLERVYGAEALTVAVQDGKAAGQTVVEHVHAHVIPRKMGDMDGRGGNDAVYDLLERGEGKESKAAAAKPDSAEGERKARSEEEMNAEADWLRGEMEKELELGTEGKEEDEEGKNKEKL